MVSQPVKHPLKKKKKPSLKQKSQYYCHGNGHIMHFTATIETRRGPTLSKLPYSKNDCHLILVFKTKGLHNIVFFFLSVLVHIPICYVFYVIAQPEAFIRVKKNTFIFHAVVKYSGFSTSFFGVMLMTTKN